MCCIVQEKCALGQLVIFLLPTAYFFHSAVGGTPRNEVHDSLGCDELTGRVVFPEHNDLNLCG